MKIKNILLSATIFAFVGCGGTGADTNPELGTEQQGAMGNYNNTFGSKNIAGIWDVYGVNNNYVNRNQPSARFELDAYGKLYNVPANGVQKQQIATYNLVSDQELKISTQSGVVIAQYVSADQKDNSCFYTKSTFENKVINELWCKKAEAGFQGADWQQQGSEDDVVQPVKFKDFLYPYDTITNGIRMTEDVHVYEDLGQGPRYQGYYEREFRKIISENTEHIYEKHNGQEYKVDEIYSSNIFSFDADSSKSMEYPSTVEAGYRFDRFTSDGINLDCRVERITKGIDLSNLLDSSVIQNFESHSESHYYSQSNLLTYRNNTIHIHCDASNGATLDEYYVDARGNVLTISRFQDGSSRYEILDKLSLRN